MSKLSADELPPPPDRVGPYRIEASLSVQGSILGTGRAMSPEQAMGDSIDHRSDLFSFGSMLYEITTGRPPFMGSSIFHTLAQVCSDRQKPAMEVNSRVPPVLSDLIDQLLEKNPTQRPQSASEVASVLIDISSHLRLEGGSAVTSVPPFGQDQTSVTAGMNETTRDLEPTESAGTHFSSWHPFQHPFQQPGFVQ